MKKHNFTTPMVLKFERLSLMHARPFTVIHESFLFYFCPIYEWTNTLKLLGKKANNKSTKPGMELFGLRDWIKSQTRTTALANKDT